MYSFIIQLLLIFRYSANLVLIYKERKKEKKSKK